MNTPIYPCLGSEKWTTKSKLAIVSPWNTKKKTGMECRINGRNSPCKVGMPGNRQRTGDSIALKYEEKKRHGMPDQWTKLPLQSGHGGQQTKDGR